jgi:hypothetical protein
MKSLVALLQHEIVALLQQTFVAVLQLQSTFDPIARAIEQVRLVALNAPA